METSRSLDCCLLIDHDVVDEKTREGPTRDWDGRRMVWPWARRCGIEEVGGIGGGSHRAARGCRGETRRKCSRVFHVLFVSQAILAPAGAERVERSFRACGSYFSCLGKTHRENGILFPNNHRQHRTSHAPKDALPSRVCERRAALSHIARVKTLLPRLVI